MRPLQGFGPRSGRASLWILALLALCSLALWFPTPSSEGLPEIPSPVETAPALLSEAPASLPDRAEVNTARDTEAKGRPQGASRTDGIGSLRGVLLDRTGEGVPTHWTLVMKPNTAIRTPSPRRELRVEFKEAEERFEIPDVPLGAYDVWVEAPRINSNAVPVLLVRGSESPFISLELHPRGYLEGNVLDEDGAPVGELLVTIISIKGWDRSTRTDGAGRYIFKDLQDGEYELVMGARQNPLVGPEQLSFRAPSLRYPLRRVPVLGSMRVRALDQSRIPINGARIDGYAPDGGNLAGFSDSEGYCIVSNLVPGRYHLSVQGNGDSTGRGNCFVTAGERAEIEIIVRD